MAYSAIPFEITHGVDLTSISRVRAGAEIITLHQRPGPTPIYLTVFTSMFMHGSWLHIIGNMLYLHIFGDQIEDRLGHFRFLVFYIVCGIVASLAHVYSAPNALIPSLGASGAIAGVLGAYLILFPRNGVRVLVFRDVIIMPASIVLGLWILLQFVGQSNDPASGGGVAYMAHIGGFVSGVVLIVLFGRERRKSRR